MPTTQTVECQLITPKMPVDGTVTPLSRVETPVPPVVLPDRPRDSSAIRSDYTDKRFVVAIIIVIVVVVAVVVIVVVVVWQDDLPDASTTTTRYRMGQSDHLASGQHEYVDLHDGVLPDKSRELRVEMRPYRHTLSCRRCHCYFSMHVLSCSSARFSETKLQPTS